ncbi:MAG: hypothetical protein WA655_08350 [Candidatus Korobacteraceae bacterium]
MTLLRSATLLILLAPLTAAAQQIPYGTVLPVMLSSTLDAGKDKPGRKISGRIMQDVPLPDGELIPRRALIVGHVVSVTKAGDRSGSHLAVSFDQLTIKGRAVPILVHLRALASMTEVFEARMPTNAWDDYGTSPSDWNTVQVGGAGVYRGSGEVIADGRVVGRSTDYGAVTAKLIAAPASGCRGVEDESREQALWVFSPWACGPYGFSDLKTIHAGRTEPVGQIAFQSSRNVYIQGGSGWLLRAESSSGRPSSTN